MLFKGSLEWEGVFASFICTCMVCSVHGILSSVVMRIPAVRRSTSWIWSAAWPSVEVERVDVVTRLVQDRRVSADYGRSVEVMAPGARILRFPFGPKRYLRKEQLWPHLEDLADQLVHHLTQPGQEVDWIHAHYADAGFVGALVSQRLGLPLVFTGHSLGREKQRRLLAGGGDRQQIEQAYAMSRRIEAEE